jgi:antitoxin (DNA-binding transcriptional repressor) of toxin-antitoxin stability system
MEKPPKSTFHYHLTPTELARNLSETLHRVRYQGQEVIISKAEEPIARFVPYGPAVHMTARELVELLRSAPGPDQAYLDTVGKLAKKQPRLPRSPWGR